MRWIAVGVALCALSGCALVPAKVQLTVDQALLVAEPAMTGINQGAEAAARSGVLHGARATTVKHSIDAANNAVSAAFALKAKGDLPGAIARINEAFADIASVQQEVKK